MSSYTVRPATQKDVRAIAEIHVTVWQAAYKGLMPDEHLAGLKVEARVPLWKEAVEYGDPQVVVVCSGGEVVGFVGFDRSRDPKSKPTTGEIWAMYVKPEHWGQGAGLALWDAAREGLLEEDCTDVTLWVLFRNDRALRFYDLAGFKREMTTARTNTIGGVKLEEIRLKRSLS